MSEERGVSTRNAPDLPEGFKMTALGPLPEEWQVVRLREIVRTKKFTLNPRDCGDETFDYYSIPAYQKLNRPIPEKGRKIRSSKLLVEEGTVLFGKLNPRVPKVWLVEASERRKIASTEFIPLFPIKGMISSNFLYFLCWSGYIMPRAQELVSGSTPSRQRVDVEAFLQLPIPLPPLPEQRAIAYALRTVQRAKEATERVIAALKELKRSLMKHLFTYGPVPLDQADQVPLKETEIGPIPEHWKVVTLSDVASVITGPFGSQLKKSDLTTSGFKVYEQENVIQKDLSLGCDYIDQDKYSILKRFAVHPGDILVSRVGSVGHAIVIPENAPEGIIGSRLLRIRVDNRKINSSFLVTALQSYSVQCQMLERAHGVVMKGINTSILKSIQVPVPPFSEQSQIARILQTVDCKIEAEENRKRALEALFKTLLHHLMTAQVRLPADFVARFSSDSIS